MEQILGPTGVLETNAPRTPDFKVVARDQGTKQKQVPAEKNIDIGGAGGVRMLWPGWA